MSTAFAVDVIQVGISCLLIVAVGYILSYFKILKPIDFGRADRFAGKVCFPLLQFRCLAYRKLSEYSFDPLFNAMLMNASSQILLCIFFLLPFKDPLEFYLSTTISSVFVNYVPIGAIVIEQVWGPGLEHIIGICPLSNFLVLVPFFLIESQLWEIKKKKLEMAASDQLDGVDPESLKITWRDVLAAFLAAIRAPIVVGTLIGFLWSLIGIPYPPFFEKFGNYLGDIVLVFGLLGVGHVLQKNGLIACHWLQLVFLLCVRFILCPCISWIYVLAFKLKGRIARLSIIFSALPSSNGAYVIAQTACVGVKATSSMILFTLILIVPILILWFYIFDSLGLYMD
ncbi:Auxin Efflux Carrier family protein [Tritrichomonas foetus]|uniref:Auxin Efflux Carrier family protein n=1 Tax=Tritrichomonas foetus TaxID=1144522 RepID=A0A1J4KGN4_9EUKA|nr:Auxin Efflux Carrier family protein [Tritrichomonas foetus]|eukprot:OHT10379.1 Auxin Efflux Carrier family protein [Tritrichomonas foetus]